MPSKFFKGIQNGLVIVTPFWILVVFLFLTMCSGAEGQSFQWSGRETNENGCMEIWQSNGGSIEDAKHIFSNVRCVEIKGPCMSACTMALGHPNVSWNENASFHFHAGWVRDGWAVRIDPSATLEMYIEYPNCVQRLLRPSEWTVDNYVVWSAEFTNSVFQSCE